ncbi:MAG: uracil phosphoribosyltransferase [Oscillospiraceae bacterium]|jgi:uracil phosphoribosyltransferase|nr:uracil phosphoribosyltransferase [Oscillospiraceae bacterium]
MSLTVLTHPLIQHKLTILRDAGTGVKVFREVVSEIAMLMCYEAMRNLPLAEVEIETPVAPAHSMSLEGKKLALVPILRAGLGMVGGVLDLVPSAKVAHIGIYRDPETLQPVEYYCKLPPDIGERQCFILDPMLATGGTAAAAAQYLKDAGARIIKLLSIISAPPGVEKLEREHPDVEIFTCAVDSHLNSHGYIVPGLGDAGDRIFGTK